MTTLSVIPVASRLARAVEAQRLAQDAMHEVSADLLRQARTFEAACKAVADCDGMHAGVQHMAASILNQLSWRANALQAIIERTK